MDRPHLLAEGFVPVAPDDWHDALTAIGAKPHIRLNIVAKMEDRGGLELLVHPTLKHMATIALGLE